MNNLLTTYKQAIKKTIRYALSPLILGDFYAFRKTPGAGRFKIEPKDFYPNIKDKTITTGYDRHYVYHTSWAARVVKEINPEFHVDISSSLFFSGLVSAFVPVNFYDYRPADLRLSDLKTGHADLQNLPFETASVKSISCMHTLEHIGLGRYGDPIDGEGDLKAIKSLKRVVAKDGSLLIVVPLGMPKIEFNAHRIYSYEQIISYFVDDEMYLNEFSYIPEFEEQGGLVRNADPKHSESAHYACGCFWFKKR
jgi:SAM-dependent methyltransferase